jgi:hypothetical protein
MLVKKLSGEVEEIEYIEDKKTIFDRKRRDGLVVVSEQEIFFDGNLIIDRTPTPFLLDGGRGHKISRKELEFILGGYATFLIEDDVIVEVISPKPPKDPENKPRSVDPQSSGSSPSGTGGTGEKPVDKEADKSAGKPKNS